MRTKGLLFTLGVLTIVLNLGVVSAAPHPEHHISFVGACRTTFAPPEFIPPNQARFIVDGSCELTPLGPATVHIDQIATFNLDGTSESDATITYTFANGDQLVAHSLAQGGAPNPQGVFLFTATQSFIGGTGRFAQATGSTRWTVGVVDTATLQGAFAFAGEIDD